MSAIVNDRDLLLAAADKRVNGTVTRVLLVTASSSVVYFDLFGTPTPASVTLRALTLGISGAITWSATPAVPLTVTDDVAVLAAADLVAHDSVVVTASLHDVASGDYSSSATITKIASLSGPRGAGNFYVFGTVWSDAAADSATPGDNIAGDTVTISNGVDFVDVRRWDGSAWVEAGTVLDGSWIIPGTVTASKINANGLSIRKPDGTVILDATSGNGVYVGDLSAVSGTFNNLQVVPGGALSSGQSAFDTGTGFWLGVAGGVPVFSIGQAGGASMKWDGTKLRINKGTYTSDLAVTVLINNVPNQFFLETNVGNGQRNYGSARATATGGSPPYSYTWNALIVDGPNEARWAGVDSPAVDAVVLKGNASSTSMVITYTCTVTDANGASVTGRIGVQAHHA